MSSNVLEFRQKTDSTSLASLYKLLKSLKEKEQGMKNPLLKDWFAIKNQIRAIERAIGGLK